MPPLRRVAVFCGSSNRTRPVFTEAAAATGRLRAEAGIGVVYGGGDIGLMRAMAEAALAGVRVPLLSEWSGTVGDRS